MSRGFIGPARAPFIALVDKAARALRADMVDQVHERGYPEITSAHNAVFATLPSEGARAADMATRAGITRQSMGEAIRDMVGMGFLEMNPDPDDRRAKVVGWTARGLELAQGGKDYMIELEQRFIAEFGEADYETTRRVLERVREMLEADGPAPA